MPFGSFVIESAFFLSLVTILSSLPADPYFQPWYDGPPAYSLSQTFYNPHPPERNNPRFPNQFFYGPPPREEGYHPDPRAYIPPESQHRRSDPYSGDEYQEAHGNVHLEVRNIGNSYSSHCAGNQKEREKTPKNIRENIEPIFGFEGSERVDATIIFQNPARGSRGDGDAKDGGILNPRIVTPKRGRRPTQGSPTKNQNRPGSTNTISTTEKTFRNQTKGAKRPRPNRPHGDDIVFPDGYTKRFVPRMTKCAKKSTFCEHLGEEYPSDYISQVLRSEGAMFKEFFGSDLISDPNITERINVPEENSLCPYRQEVVFPRAAQNKEDKWLFIVNQDQYVQGVTVEVCLNPESRCILTEGFPLGYTPYCKQKYIERRLVAIGEDGKPHSDSFRLPSCCSCVVKHEATARMGLLLPQEGARGAPQQ